MKELQYLNKYFVKYKYHFLLGILITIVAQIFALFTPKLISQGFVLIENQLSSELTDATELKRKLLNILGLIIGTTLISGFLTFLMRQTLIVMSRHVEFDLKNEIFRQYERLDQHFYKSNRTGDLMNRISEDVSKVRMYVGPAVMYSINTVIRFGIVVLYMYWVSPLLTLYTLLPLPILSYLIFKVSKEINKRSTIFQENLSRLSSFTQELFSGIRVVKAYALEHPQSQKFESLAFESRDKNIDLARINALFGPLMILLIGLSNLVVIYVGGMMYIDGEITSLGTIAEFILYVNMLTWPVASIGWVSSLVQEAEASQKRINDFLTLKPEILDESIEESNSLTESNEINGAITFKNVSFVYPDTGIQALKNVSFTIESGKTLAILGKTGSGKSSILQLVSRLYDPTDGVIEMGGKPIKTLALSKLRASTGVVPQDAFLFSDTIENNIRFGDENATSEQVYSAAKSAQVHDSIVNFPKGYQTVLGERGITLSGGQKQRVSIARALLKNPNYLFFDDCLSAVDTETEEAILKNLLDFSKDKTTLLVSHRVSSAKNADWIIILDQGEILEQGSHNQLIDRKGAYFELYQKQLEDKEMN
jgi:ATP-binding cassette, subfamily B, multidrug efflux pump